MKHVASYQQLAQFGRELLDNPSLEVGLPLITKYLKEVLNVERCSIFIYNKKLSMLWTIVAEGTHKIILSAEEGVVGQCVKSGEPKISNSPYEDENFCKKIDKKSGFITKNIAVVPILSSDKSVMGALELLNKQESFTQDDLRFMKFFCTYISGYLELALLFEDESKFLLKERYKFL